MITRTLIKIVLLKDFLQKDETLFIVSLLSLLSPLISSQEPLAPSRLFSLSPKDVLQSHRPILTESYQSLFQPNARSSLLLKALESSLAWLMMHSAHAPFQCHFKCIVFLDRLIYFSLFFTGRAHGSCLIRYPTTLSTVLHALQTLNEYLLTAKNLNIPLGVAHFPKIGELVYHSDSWQEEIAHSDRVIEDNLIKGLFT